MTTAPITPCLWFDGCAREAAEFYVSIFPDSRILHGATIGEGNPSPYPVGTEIAVLFELEGRPFFGLNGGPGFPFTHAVSFQTFAATQEEVDARWDALVEGGQALECCWLTDKFGVPWQIVPQAYLDAVADGGDRATRAMNALLTMVKPDVAALERAIAGE